MTKSTTEPLKTSMIFNIGSNFVCKIITASNKAQISRRHSLTCSIILSTEIKTQAIQFTVGQVDMWHSRASAKVCTI